MPIGAVVTGADGTVLARAANAREREGDPTAHAEVLALRAAARSLGDGWRLAGATLAVTLEPCTMCAGAAVAARVSRLVFGAWDPKAGAVGSLWDVVRDRRLPHRAEVRGGVLAEECGVLLREFFAVRRDDAGEASIAASEARKERSGGGREAIVDHRDGDAGEASIAASEARKERSDPGVDHRDCAE